MTLHELNAAIQAKSLEVEKAIEAGIPHEKLLLIYKELKELQFLKVQAELKEVISE